jgi:novel protein kinase C delta type
LTLFDLHLKKKKVFLVSDRSSSGYYAMKALKKDVVLQEDDVDCTMLERDVLKLGEFNPFLAKLYCTFQNQEYLFYIMEFLNGGDLMFHVVNKKRFDEDTTRFYCAEIICGLEYLHENLIVRTVFSLS